MAKKKKLTPTEQYVLEIMKEGWEFSTVKRAVRLTLGPKKTHLYYRGTVMTMRNIERVLDKWTDYGLPEGV